MVLIVNEDSSRVHDSIGLYKTRPNFPELLFRQVGYVKVTLSRWPSKSLTIHQTYGVKIMRRNIVSYDNFDSWGEHLPGFRLVDSVARLRFLDCNFINLTVRGAERIQVQDNLRSFLSGFTDRYLQADACIDRTRFSNNSTASWLLGRSTGTGLDWFGEMYGFLVFRGAEGLPKVIPRWISLKSLFTAARWTRSRRTLLTVVYVTVSRCNSQSTHYIFNLQVRRICSPLEKARLPTDSER